MKNMNHIHGEKPITLNEFGNIFCMEIDEHDNLYISCETCIIRLSKTMKFTLLAGTPRTPGYSMTTEYSRAKFSSIQSMVFDGDGNLILCDTYNSLLRKILINNDNIDDKLTSDLKKLINDNALHLNFNSRYYPFKVNGVTFILNLDIISVRAKNTTKWLHSLEK